MSVRRSMSNVIKYNPNDPKMLCGSLASSQCVFYGTFDKLLLQNMSEDLTKNTTFPKPSPSALNYPNTTTKC